LWWWVSWWYCSTILDYRELEMVGACSCLWWVRGPSVSKCDYARWNCDEKACTRGCYLMMIHYKIYIPSDAIVLQCFVAWSEAHFGCWCSGIHVASWFRRGWCSNLDCCSVINLCSGQ
jgi:hypothetical protein